MRHPAVPELDVSCGSTEQKRFDSTTFECEHHSNRSERLLWFWSWPQKSYQSSLNSSSHAKDIAITDERQTLNQFLESISLKSQKNL
jgi:hypothetical protein